MPLELKAKSVQHFAAAEICHPQSSAIEILNHPFPFQSDFQDGCTQRSANMRSPLAPVHASVSKPPPQPADLLEVNAKTFKRFRPGQRKFVPTLNTLHTGRQPPQCLKAVMQRHAHGSCNVIVASPRLAQPAGCVWHKCIMRPAS